MTDFLSFDEGRRDIAATGLPPTCWFLLSTKPCSDHAVDDTLADVGEITGTGYIRQGGLPEPSFGNPTTIGFDAQVWFNGQTTDWDPACSVVMASSPDNSGAAICAWNLQPGGAPRDLSLPLTTEQFTPTLILA